MHDGFIKVAAATPLVKVADCRYNAEQTIIYLKTAAKQQVKLVVFPELGLTAYTCADLFFQPTLLKEALNALALVVEASTELDLVGIVGLPLAVEGRLYNCAAIFARGELLAIVPKQHITKSAEFHETRWFTPAPAENRELCILGKKVPFGTKVLFCSTTVENFIFGVEICADLWVPKPPSLDHVTAGAVIIANLSASNALVSKSEYRQQLIASHSGATMSGYLYASSGSGESSTDLVFIAHNVIAENGRILCQETYIEQGLLTSEIDVDNLVFQRQYFQYFDPVAPPHYKVVYFDVGVETTVLERNFSPTPFVPLDEAARLELSRQVLQLQATGLKTRLQHTGIQKVVLGLSGGLDSTLALLVAVETFDYLELPRGAIEAITMPCFGTSERTLRNAQHLANVLNVTLNQIDISAAVRQHFVDIGQPENLHNTVYENAQARERTQVLFDRANALHALVVGTGDLSELALGWTTFGADQISMYNVNVSVPKTLVRSIVASYSATCQQPRLSALLDDILATPVSPELLPSSQETESIIGPYELHDFFLYHTVRSAFPPAKMVRVAQSAFGSTYSRSELLQWLELFYRRFFANQFKRSMLPDGPKVGSVSLSPRGDWRMSSDSSAVLWLEEIARLKTEEIA